MAAKFGFYTGELEIKPYLSRDEIAKDAQAELIPDVYRRPGKSYYIIPTEQVEPYYRSKQLPDAIIHKKLVQLKLKNETLAESIANHLMKKGFKPTAEQLDIFAQLS